jgi:RNA polymerase sigma factor (sigma-70 family)
MDTETTSVPGPVAPAAQAVDEATFAALYPALRRFAAVVADVDIDPDDLVQDALAGLLRMPAGHVIDVNGYLRRSIVNAVASARRRKARDRELQARDRAGAGGAVVVAYPTDVREVLDAIPARDRALLYLLDVERQPVADVAMLLGITAVAARVRALRARRVARARLTRGSADA